MSRLLRALGAAAAIVTVIPAIAAAEPVEDFYKGRTVTIVVGSEAGGAYDLYARFFGQYASKYVPGHPNFIYQYMPGSGGVKIANYMYNAAPKDGSVIGMMEQGTPLARVLRKDPGMKFDLGKYNWIGTVAQSFYLIGIWHTAPATTIEGARQKEVLLAASGKGSTTYIYPALINYIAGTKLKVILGYKGAPDMDLSYERGETNGRGGTLSAWQIRQRAKVDAGLIKFMVQIAPKRNPVWPEVPMLSDYAKTGEQRAIVDFMQAPSLVGTSLFTPPGTPPDRVSALRKAFDQTMKDPAMLAEVKKRDVYITGEPGVEIQAAMVKLAATPQALVDKVRSAIGIK
jgi:tripartite-type tricarboxylate transporter receptor subunit TctC